jgi:ribonuclease VapC
MVIDTSVLIAILANEPEAELFEAAIDADPVRLISAASVLETAIVAEARYGDIGGRELDLLLYKAEIQIVAVTADQIDVGRRAFSKYGKGRHPAALNFGDCFSYALAKTSGEPLLFKGNDFPQTDVASDREKFPPAAPHNK